MSTEAAANPAQDNESYEISREDMLEHLLLTAQVKNAELALQLCEQQVAVAKQQLQTAKTALDVNLQQISQRYSENGAYELVTPVDATTRIGQRRKK